MIYYNTPDGMNIKIHRNDAGDVLFNFEKDGVAFDMLRLTSDGVLCNNAGVPASFGFNLEDGRIHVVNQ